MGRGDVERRSVMPTVRVTRAHGITGSGENNVEARVE